MVGGAGLGLDLAEELGRLGPFGMGNPGVRLMVPSARVSDVRTMGEGKHARFSLHSGAHRALGVAFGRSSLGVGEEDPVDAAVRLEVNQWNGAVEPRVVLRELYPVEDAEDEAPLHACRCEEAEWWQRFDAELRRELARESGMAGLSPIGHTNPPGGGSACSSAAAARRPRRSPSWSPAVPGCSRSAPTPRAGRRWRVERAAWLASTAARRGSPATGAGATASPPWRSAVRAASPWSTSPLWSWSRSWPSGSSTSSLSTRLPGRPTRRGSARPRPAGSPSFLHELWTESERRFALTVAEAQAPSRETVAIVFKAPAGGGRVRGRQAARGAGRGRHPSARPGRRGPVFQGSGRAWPGPRRAGRGRRGRRGRILRGNKAGALDRVPLL